MNGAHRMQLRIATCQFPVDRNIERNCGYITRQMKAARGAGAHVAHFSESCLGGYAGFEVKTFRGYDWDLLRKCTLEVMDLACQLKLWTILGSNHPLTGKHKPHNSLYVINDRGKIVNRYDKMFCCGDRSGKSDDLKYYTPGSKFVVVTIKGVKCGLLICHDYRYPELYRQYKKLGAKLVFHSYHCGNTSAGSLRKSFNIWGVTAPPAMQTAAASNNVWISANNTSKRECSFGSFVVRPDGIITGKLPRNRAGLLMTAIDTRTEYYDASEAWRDRAMNGIYHSGRLVRDRRSRNRRSL